MAKNFIIAGYSVDAIKYYLSVLENKKGHHHQNKVDEAYERLYKVVYGRDFDIINRTTPIHKNRVTATIVNTQNLLTALDLFKD